MNKKLKILLLIVLMSPLMAGLYGILHSQLTYTISPEYFTKFKFIRAGIIPGVNDRLEISRIGFLATWWLGLYMGIGIAIVGLIHSASRDMRRISFQSMLIAVCITFLTGMIGLAYGFAFLSDKPREFFSGWFMPPDLEQHPRYVAVYSMHNFSFIGGALGLAAAAFWQFLKKEKSTAN